MKINIEFEDMKLQNLYDYFSKNVGYDYSLGIMNEILNDGSTEPHQLLDYEAEFLICLISTYLYDVVGLSSIKDTKILNNLRIGIMGCFIEKGVFEDDIPELEKLSAELTKINTTNYSDFTNDDLILLNKLIDIMKYINTK